MQGRLSLTISAYLCAAVAVACGGTTVTELSGPGPARCLTSFATPAPTIPAEGGKAAVTISSERECTWSARGDGSWIQVSPTSGQGEATVTITASPNPEASPRRADLVVNDQRLSVTQEPAPCEYELGSTGETVPAAGGRTSVRISVLSGCGWTASSPQPWVHVLTSSGSGTATIEFAVDPNSGAARSAQLTVADRPFTITQEKFTAAPTPAPPTPAPTPPPAPPPPPSPAPEPSPEPTPPRNCSYSIDPESRDLGRRARNDDIKVETADGCTWTAESNVNWISITSGSRGTGDGKVAYHVDENPGLFGRVGTMRVAGHTFFVYQRGLLGGDDD